MPSRQHEPRSLEIRRCNEQPIEVRDGIDLRSVQKQLPIGHAPQKRRDIRAQRRFANAAKVDPEGQLRARRDAGWAGKGWGGDGERGSVSVAASVPASASVSASVPASFRGTPASISSGSSSCAAFPAHRGSGKPVARGGAESAAIAISPVRPNSTSAGSASSKSKSYCAVALVMYAKAVTWTARDATSPNVVENASSC